MFVNVSFFNRETSIVLHCKPTISVIFFGAKICWGLQVQRHSPLHWHWQYSAEAVRECVSES